MAKDKESDKAWLFWTMLRVLKVLDSAKKEGVLLSEDQILKAAFPEIFDRNLMRIAKFNVRRRLKRDLVHKVIKKIDNPESPKTAYYCLR